VIEHWPVNDRGDELATNEMPVSALFAGTYVSEHRSWLNWIVNQDHHTPVDVQWLR